MELHHIRYFLAVAEEGSITGAAARLSIAQPHLSRQIRDLESELEITLFVRSKGRACVLTPEGQKLLPYARQIIDLVDRIHETFCRPHGHAAASAPVHDMPQTAAPSLPSSDTPDSAIAAKLDYLQSTLDTILKEVRHD